VTSTFPTLSVQAQFGGSWTDITAYVRSGTISRPGSRLMGPVWTYQAGTCSLVLKATDGRFDPDNSASPYWGGTASRTATYTTSGTFTPPQGVTSLDTVECWGGGGGGGNEPAGSDPAGGGGGGGEYAKELNVAVSFKAYAVTVGAAGAGGVGSGSTRHNGTDGGDTTFPGDAVTVTANGGSGGVAGGAGGGGGTGGAGGTGSTNTTHHDGGAGAAGGIGYSGGGGSSAGTAAAGNAGSTHTGGAAVTGGGPGANGASASGGGAGSTPSSGPGGGGGGGVEGGKVPAPAGGNGAAGQVKIAYTVSTAQTQVLPMVPIQITATWNSVTYPLFYGYADSWADNGQNYAGRYAEVTLNATDAFKIFSNINLAELGSPVGGGEDSGARVSRILDAASWSPSLRAIDTGDSGQQATSFGDTVMGLLQLTSDTELGSLYVDGSGNVTFRHRLAYLSDTRSNTPQGVFGDSPGTVETDGTELRYQIVPRASDDTAMVNDCQITAANGGTLQEATDSDSIAQFLYPRTYSRTDLLLQSDSEALSYAQWIVYVGSSAEDRVDTLTLMPRRDTTNMFPQALGRELGDRIQVWRRPPGVSAFSKDVFIQGISHVFDASSQTWQTQWTLTSAAKYGSFLTLDDSTLGQLNENALAF
jgi:hypothetical protein